MIDDLNKGNGVIDYNEFIDVLLKTRAVAIDEAQNREEIREAFKVFDLNGDGTITVNLIYKFENLPSETLFFHYD